MLLKLDFDNFYKSKKDYSYSDSLLSFFLDCLISRIESNSKVLDIGCGNYSIFEDVKTIKLDVTAIDFSSVAISSSPQSSIKYLHLSVLDHEYFSIPKFDLIFDSHCLNCIEEIKIDLVLENIFNSLKIGGIFASEVMVQPNGAKVISSEKSILESRDIESKLIDVGFKIVYFVISSKINFSVSNQNVDLLRFIAVK
jgi:SAM-dependent methyltransferase